MTCLAKLGDYDAFVLPSGSIVAVTQAEVNCPAENEGGAATDSMSHLAARLSVAGTAAR